MSPPDEGAAAPPPSPDIWEEPAGAATYHSANHMPPELRDQLRELEKWALANKGDATRDAMAFWGLKLPAILASASAGVWAHFELTTVSVLAGAIASLCVNPSEILGPALQQLDMLNAARELRDLQSPPGNRLEA